MSTPLTISQKILQAHGVDDPQPGGFGLARCDLVLLNDVSGAVATRAFEKMGAEKVFDPARVALVVDHFTPAKDVRSAQLATNLRDFAKAYDIDNFWEVGATEDAGIEHTLLPELGFIAPGAFIPGGDSHTCTYGAFGALGTGMGSTDIAAAMALGEVWVRIPQSIRVLYRGEAGRYVTGKDLILAYLAHSGASGATYAALEFEGQPVTALNIDERMALCNMAVEAGAKTGIVAADETTTDWLADRVADPASLTPVTADPDAVYDSTVDIDLDGMAPLVARPPSPADVAPVDDLDGPVRIDQVYVGNCSNGTMTDLRQLASMLEGRHVAAGTRLIVVPATQRILRQAMAEGLVDTILAAGGMLSPPTCGACFGGHMGILGPGETAVATTNRNFKGRMGHPDSQVFLANAYIAGAAAVTGELVHPSEVGG